jgi:hypothetical protein
MNLKLSLEANLNYCCKIVKLENIERVPDADRLVYTTIDGRNLIIADNFKVGDICVYFPVGCKINNELLSFLNGFRHKELNADKEKAGFFETNARVKIVKLRGMFSEGFIIHLTDLLHCFPPKNEEDSSFTEDLIWFKFDTINGVNIVEKYVVKQRSGAGLGNTRAKKSLIEDIVDDQFKFNVKITKLGEVIYKLQPEQHFNLSIKLHGTSAVSAYVLCKRKLNLWERLLKKIGVKIQENEYKYVCSSRTVIKTIDDDKQADLGFYDFDIWTFVHNKIKNKLFKGMTFYYEIVGYLPSGAMIQKDYDYGFESPENGEFVFGKNAGAFIYRITYTDSQGNVVEYPMTYVKEFCNNNNLSVVPIQFDGKVKELLHYPDADAAGDTNMDYQNAVFDVIKNDKSMFMEEDCPMCKNKVPFEGLVVRFEGNNYYDAYKLKCQRFMKREDDELDKGESTIEDEQ